MEAWRRSGLTNLQLGQQEVAQQVVVAIRGALADLLDQQVGAAPVGAVARRRRAGR